MRRRVATPVGAQRTKQRQAVRTLRRKPVISRAVIVRRTHSVRHADPVLGSGPALRAAILRRPRRTRAVRRRLQYRIAQPRPGNRSPSSPSMSIGSSSCTSIRQPVCCSSTTSSMGSVPCLRALDTSSSVSSIAMFWSTVALRSCRALWTIARAMGTAAAPRGNAMRQGTGAEGITVCSAFRSQEPGRLPEVIRTPPSVESAKTPDQGRMAGPRRGLRHVRPGPSARLPAPR